jgi:putative oxidoreductase
MLSSISVKKNAPWWDWFLILIIAAVFGYAGVVKLQGVADFSHVIARFDVLPSALINPAALILSTVEILLAGVLLVPALQRPALLGVLFCSAMFCIVLISAIIRGIPVSCGCFSLTEKPSLHAAWWALGRDVILLGVSIQLYLRRVCFHTLKSAQVIRIY